MSLLLALLMTPTALAADGFWHPNDLMSSSQAFGRLNEGAMAPFEERSRRTQELAQALNNYALALDLLGGAATDEQKTRLDDLEKQFNRDKAQLEAFASALIEDVDTVFYDGVERALAPLEGEYAMCEREIPTGPQVPGMRPRTEPNPECTGDDVNAKIVAALDRDAELKAAIDEIVALEWPNYAVDTTPQPAIGTAGAWIGVRPLFAKGAAAALKKIDYDDENARLPFQSAIEEGADKAELERLAKDAEKIEAKTAKRRADLAAPVLEAADKALDKWGESVGWCANPIGLGGCEGDNRTNDLIQRLLDDKRVSKSLSKATDAVGG